MICPTMQINIRIPDESRYSHHANHLGMYQPHRAGITHSCIMTIKGIIRQCTIYMYMPFKVVYRHFPYNNLLILTFSLLF